MSNPYRDNMDKIQALVKRLTREHLYSVSPNASYMEDSSYGVNYVVASGEESFEADLAAQLKDLMKEVTDDPDPEAV